MLLLYSFKLSLSNICIFKSFLFNNIIEFLSLIEFNISISSSDSSFDISKIAIIKSLFSAISFDFFIPIFSTSSFAFLIPAVSINFNGIPLIVINSSIVSLVVPSYSVTIALSSFNIAFNKDDFPAFGVPIIAVFIPSLIILPFLNDFSSFSSFSSIVFNLFKAFSFVLLLYYL